MKLTIGMACYKDFETAWFTVQVLRMYQDLSDTEILLMDNFGDDRLKRFVDNWTNGQARYVRWTEVQGSAPAKGRVFAEARGDFVVCIDPHVLLWPGAVARLRGWFDANRSFDGLVHGPLFYDQLTTGCDRLAGEFGTDGVWGTWQSCGDLPVDAEPYPVEKMGMGCFGCRRDAWLGFPARYRGFGAEEGIIHRKYARAGRKTMLLPFLRWVHLFRDGTAPYVPKLDDKVRNTVIGFMENGDNLDLVFKRFGDAARQIHQQLTSGGSPTTVATNRPATTTTTRAPLDLYEQARTTPSDMFEHVPTLARLAAGKRVTEFGVRTGVSTVGLIHGRPKSLVSYDLNPCPREREIGRYAAERGVPWTFRIGDSRKVDIAETDVLFIDTWHSAAHFRAELLNCGARVRERVVLHDTVTNGEVGNDGTPGLMVEVRALVASGEWVIEEHHQNCHGLTVLKKAVS